MKTPFRNEGEIKTFSNERKSGESVISIPALKEVSRQKEIIYNFPPEREKEHSKQKHS